MSTFSIENNKTNQESCSTPAKNPAQTVLAVDDQPVSLAILEKLIEAQGLAVETAKDGKQALALWKEKQHSLIITDCHMPEMDGYNLAKAIREIEQTKNIDRSAIVAITANALKQEEELRCSEAGIDQMLTKPVSTTQIATLCHSRENIISANQTITTQVVDHSVLEQIFPSAGKQLEILEGFQTHIEVDYASLEEYIQQSNLSSLGSTAHRMKGSSRMVGVNGIANICEKIEEDAKNGVIASDVTLLGLNKSIHQFAIYMSKQRQNKKLENADSTLEEDLV